MNVYNIISSIFRHVFIGLTDLANEQQWVWSSDGSPLVYSNWKTGQPDGGTVENCAEKGFAAWTEWNDRACSEWALAICQKA